MCEEWCKAEEWGADPGKLWSPSLCCPGSVLLLPASLAPSGGHVMLCTLPCFHKFLTPALSSSLVGLVTVWGLEH